jgi:hypothetical protein
MAIYFHFFFEKDRLGIAKVMQWDYMSIGRNEETKEKAMKLLTKAIKAKLEKNREGGWTDAKPVVKFFNPCGAGTWLIAELDEDGDTMFGLCDPGMGSPELGYMSLAEMEAVKVPPFGLGIERDRHWTAKKTLKEYADEARLDGRINA